MKGWSGCGVSVRDRIVRAKGAHELWGYVASDTRGVGGGRGSEFVRGSLG